MIEAVGTTHGATGAEPPSGAARAASAPQPRSSFAAELATASTEGRSSAEERLERLRREIRPPRGERWEPVPGRSDYADVVSGPRNGYFVNLTDGPRRGEVFHIVRKDGRELHVYGEGRDRHVVEVKRREGPARDADEVRPREGETFEAVPGHRDYQRIEGGERDDQFINVSGNERTGRAFTIEERDGKRYHVYGTGEDKVEIHVGWRRERADERPDRQDARQG